VAAELERFLRFERAIEQGTPTALGHFCEEQAQLSRPQDREVWTFLRARFGGDNIKRSPPPLLSSTRTKTPLKGPGTPPTKTPLLDLGARRGFYSQPTTRPKFQ